jgi:hypothetical protein
VDSGRHIVHGQFEHFQSHRPPDRMKLLSAGRAILRRPFGRERIVFVCLSGCLR